MRHLTTSDAAKLMFALIQKTRASALPEREGKISMANAAALFAVVKNPGIYQNDLWTEVGGVSKSGISRHLDLLEARERDGTVDAAHSLIRKADGVESRIYKQIFLTDNGDTFAGEFARYLNKLLDSYDS